MAVYYKKLNDIIIVHGKTFPYKDIIKSLGGRFNPDEKTWQIPVSDDNLRQVIELCKSVGGGVGSLITEPPPYRASSCSDIIASDPLLKLTDTPTPPSSPENPVTDGISLADLMRQIESTITKTFSVPLWIYGETQNLGWRKSGLFFNLAEPKECPSAAATITANTTLWKSAYQNLLSKHGKEALEAVLQDGLKVRLLCQVCFYKDRGQISLNLIDIDPSYTRGSLALARETLLRELRSKGLDQLNKSLQIPRFPLRIGLISADNSRAKSDFLDQLFTYRYPGLVIFHHAQMQGNALLKQVTTAIEALAKAECDLIVLTRGGGSAADLRWFDSPEVAYAIALCKVPIISAIGHHDDICIAEEISFQREKTPTAAADFIINILLETKVHIDSLAADLALNLSRKVDSLSRVQHALSERLYHTTTSALNLYHRNVIKKVGLLSLGLVDKLRSADRRMLQLMHELGQGSTAFLQNRKHVLIQIATNLKMGAMRGFDHHTGKLAQLENDLVAKDPTPWMAKGWTQLFGDKGNISSGAHLAIGDHLAARLTDANLEMTLTRITKRKPKKG